MTSYLSESKAKSLKNGDVHLAQIEGFWNGVSQKPFGVLRSVMALFSFFMLFHLSLTFF